jgi:hypothetical protein
LTGDEPLRMRQAGPEPMPLRAYLDGVPLDDKDAKDLWGRFSAWMDAHRGDLASFARSEGFASIQPELRGGEPVLVASRHAPQGPYKSAPSKPTSGSSKTPKRRRR